MFSIRQLTIISFNLLLLFLFFIKRDNIYNILETNNTLEEDNKNLESKIIAIKNKIKKIQEKILNLDNRYKTLADQENEIKTKFVISKQKLYEQYKKIKEEKINDLQEQYMKKLIVKEIREVTDES